MSTWVPTLTANTPDEGNDFAVTFSRVGIKPTQPDAAARDRKRPDAAQEDGALILARQVVATHLATGVAANKLWRDRR